MTRALTLAAIEACSQQGHDFAWRRTWGDCGFRECARCGETLPALAAPQTHETPEPGSVTPAADCRAPSPNGEAPASISSPRAAVQPGHLTGRWRDVVTGMVYDRHGRDAEIQRLRVDERMHLEEIGERFGLTMQRVGQICKPPRRRKAQ